MNASDLKFQKGRSGTDRRASSWVCRDGTSRNNEGERQMPKIATRAVGEKIAPAKTIAPIFPSRRDAKKEFSAVILKFENGDIATEADVSKQTVKCWKAGRAFPHGEKLMNLAKNNPVILNWLLSNLGASQAPEMWSDPRVITAVMGLVHRMTFEKDPDGDVARALSRGEMP